MEFKNGIQKWNYNISNMNILKPKIQIQFSKHIE